MYIRMKHTENEGINPYDVVDALNLHFADTRFKVNVELRQNNSRSAWIHLTGVRLKPEHKKSWCGNHAESCSIQGIRKGDGTFLPAGREMKSSALLEGLDWVDFNDQVNDVLDKLNANAEGRSTYAPVLWRNGKRRRIRYTSNKLENLYRVEYEWEEVGDWDDYEDWCGREGAPASEYPHGTPGIYSRKVKTNDSQ